MIAIKAFYSIVGKLTNYGKWVGLVTLTALMFLLTISSLSRSYFVPIVGDVELVQLGMLVLIMFSLGYTQKENSHITIGLLVDRLPKHVQYIIDIVIFSCIFIVCMIISLVTFNVAIDNMLNNPRYTDLLEISFYPFRFIIAIGFILWGLESLVKVIQTITLSIKGNAELDQ